MKRKHWCGVPATFALKAAPNGDLQKLIMGSGQSNTTAKDLTLCALSLRKNQVTRNLTRHG